MKCKSREITTYGPAVTGFYCHAQTKKLVCDYVGDEGNCPDYAPDKIGGESSDERGQARAESEGGESTER